MASRIANKVAVTLLAVSLVACGSAGSAGRGAALEGPDPVLIEGVGLVPAHEAQTYLGGMGGAEAEQIEGVASVDIPGVGLVPAHEALMYLGGMGGAE